MDADTLYRVGDVFYDISKNRHTMQVGGGIITCGAGGGYAGTIYGISDDALDIEFSYGSTYLGFTPEVGMMIAFSVSDEYIATHSSAVRLDTFRYDTSNVNTYTITYVGTNSFRCSAVTYGGKPFACGVKYTFSESDNCNVYLKSPALSHVCTHLNRAAGVTRDGKSIVLSKPGEYNKFYDFSGESTDSYSVDVAAGGDFYGCVSYNDALIAFKANCMYALWGDVPNSFQLTELSSDIGCTDKNSICICNGELYFLSANGFYKYSGAKPVCVSRKLDRHFVSAKTASDGHRMYALCKDKDGNSELLCYNTDFKIWHSLSFAPNDIFCQNNRLYLVYDYEVKRLDEEAGGEWYLESGNILESIFDNRAIVELAIRVRFFDDDSFINTYTATDNGEFVQHISLSGKGIREFCVPVRFCEGKSVRYALSGSGKCRILDIRRIYSSIE